MQPRFEFILACLGSLIWASFHWTCPNDTQPWWALSQPCGMTQFASVVTQETAVMQNPSCRAIGVWDLFYQICNMQAAICSTRSFNLALILTQFTHPNPTLATHTQACESPVLLRNVSAVWKWQSFSNCLAEIVTALKIFFWRHQTGCETEVLSLP